MIWHIIDYVRDQIAVAGISSSSLTARLVLAIVLGGLIGLEREVKHRAAGLRT